MDEVISDKCVLVASFDKKANRFGDIAQFDNTAVAIRSFGDVVSDDRTPLGKHPEDYDLVLFGYYDRYNGKVEGLESVVVLCNGFDFVRNMEEKK